MTIEAARNRDGHAGAEEYRDAFPAADYYGHPRSTQRHENWFFADMRSFIVAMAKRFPINLAITVGHPAMIGTGPLGGHAVETIEKISRPASLAWFLRTEKVGGATRHGSIRRKSSTSSERSDART